MRRFLTASIAAAALAALAVAPAAAKTQPGHAKLTRFNSCKALNGYARHHPRALRQATGPYYFAEGLTPAPTTPGTGGGTNGAPQADQTAPTSQAGTNVQEAGVDEPDIVKAQGPTIFALANGRLNAVDASGPLPALLDSLILPGGENTYSYATDLLVAGDRALVIAQSGFYTFGGGGDGGPVPLLAPYGGGGGTTLIELDISNPSQLRVLQTMKLEASYVDARLSGHTARVVVNAIPDYPAAPEEPTSSGPVQGGSTTGSGPNAVRHSAVRTRGPKWLPMATVHTRADGRTTARPLTRCREISHPSEFSGVDTLSVLTIDLDKGIEPVDSEAVTSGGETVYASKDSLYVATERWAYEGQSQSELSDVSTQIHKFDISSPDETTYRASGEVPGFMLSQWSLSEQDGLLRVASTTAPPWTENGQSAKSQSFVTVLGENGGHLGEVGQLGGLGTNQQIYAVRFIGEVGYVVTFRQVDPLYVIDLSAPESPKVTGQLEIPGYSAYLHPIGGGLLLGAGQAATQDGRLLGLQLSVFDVSDPSNPRAIAQKTVAPHASSEVEYDHHAFTYWAPTGLAALPVYYYDNQTGDQIFDGLIGFHVGSGGIDEVGRVSDGDPPRAKSMRRSLVVGGRLYAMSDNSLIGMDLDTLQRAGTVTFPGS